MVLELLVHLLADNGAETTDVKEIGMVMLLNYIPTNISSCD